MLAPFRVNDCMLRSEELLERDGLTDAPVVAAHDADIFVAEESLLKEPRFLKIREITQREIGRPGFIVLMNPIRRQLPGTGGDRRCARLYIRWI